jgi:prevent-host-death family protein
METSVWPIHKVRSKIGSILNKLQETGEPIFISRRGQTKAVLIPMNRYKTIMDLLEDREDELDAALGQRIQEEREAYVHGEGQDFEAFVTGLEL